MSHTSSTLVGKERVWLDPYCADIEDKNTGFETMLQCLDPETTSGDGHVRSWPSTGLQSAHAVYDQVFDWIDYSGLRA